LKRILTALCLLPIFIFVVISPKIYFFAALTAVAAVLAELEYFSIAKGCGFNPWKALGVCWTLAFIAVALWPRSLQLEVVISAGFMSLIIMTLFSKYDLKKAFDSISSTIFGVFYIGFFLAYFIALKSQGTERGKDLLLLLAFTVWAGDTAAYFVGSAIGKHKLAPKISPKKSWEGSIANVAASLLMAHIARLTFIQSIDGTDVLILGFAISVIGQLGDLFESVLKRAAEIKDSGNILPGHGGILDRIDSLIFTAPVLYYYHQVYMR
jgi:phosphatidate cytidylyltransferase